MRPLFHDSDPLLAGNPEESYQFANKWGQDELVAYISWQLNEAAQNNDCLSTELIRANRFARTTTNLVPIETGSDQPYKDLSAHTLHPGAEDAVFKKEFFYRFPVISNKDRELLKALERKREPNACKVPKFVRASRQKFQNRYSDGAWLNVACLGTIAIFMILGQSQTCNFIGKPAAQQPAEIKPHIATRSVSAAEVEAVPEDLRFARWLVSRGKLKSAIPYYEACQHQDPDKIPLRMELIKVYIAAKESHKARLLCIRTLKKHLNSADIGMVWQQLSQCQTS